MTREEWILLASLFASGNLVMVYWNIKNFFRYGELREMFTWLPFSLFIHLWIDFIVVSCLLVWSLKVRQK